jgi:uncharacterized protein YbjQ (UPF0145 family)
MSARAERPVASAQTPDLHAEVLLAAQALSRPPEHSPGAAVTSDLSIDEGLLLHAIGWEPVDLVCGVGVASIPFGVWNWGQGEIGAASAAHQIAFGGAAARLLGECSRVEGHGVVGVHVDVGVRPHHVEIELVGTAIRPVRSGRRGQAFASDLTARDFALLVQAGWYPTNLAFGASFVYAPRRSAGTALKQKAQNVELVNMTEAMYSAREAAMERMQNSAVKEAAQGIVAVTVTEGPMPFARHAIGFTAWGTAVRLDADAHRSIGPHVAVALDDANVVFQAQSLRGASG